MIIDLQRRIQEAGRIRIGQQVQTRNGRSRPAKLDTFRLTSSDRERIEQAAELYGGAPAQWDAPAGQQWEVVTNADAMPVIVPPSEMAFSQWYELWSAGGCQRRCDGATETIGDQPCICDPDARECAIHTRLSVMLRDLPGLGVWRIDSSGYYAAVELQGAVQVIHTAAGRGTMLPARLRLDQRSVKRQVDGKAQTRNFAVPVLDIEVTPAQLMGGATPQLGTTQPTQLEAAPATGFTPVPPDLPEAPARSIAEQSAPPPPKPKRSNAAPEIPRSGRRRNTEPAPEPEPEPEPTPESAAPGSTPITSAQSKKLHAMFREAGIASDEEGRRQRLLIVSNTLGRPVDSSADLTKDEAVTLIDALEHLDLSTATVGEQPEPPDQRSLDEAGEQQ